SLEETLAALVARPAAAGVGDRRKQALHSEAAGVQIKLLDLKILALNGQRPKIGVEHDLTIVEAVHMEHTADLKPLAVDDLQLVDAVPPPAVGPGFDLAIVGHSHPSPGVIVVHPMPLSDGRMSGWAAEGAWERHSRAA